MTTAQDQLPQILGTAGSSLKGDGAWAVNGDVLRAGAKGEAKTARVIERVCVRGGPTVLHSLRLPISGIDADIDHVVVSGRHVQIVDSKAWRPDRYWTIGHTTRRGWKRVPFADKHTSEMATRALRGLFSAARVDAVIHVPLIVVWPSNTSRAMRLRWYRPRGAKAMDGEAFDRKVDGLFRHGPADPAVVRALLPLVGVAPGRVVPTAAGRPAAPVAAFPSRQSSVDRSRPAADEF